MCLANARIFSEQWRLTRQSLRRISILIVYAKPVVFALFFPNWNLPTLVLIFNKFLCLTFSRRSTLFNSSKLHLSPLGSSPLSLCSMPPVLDALTSPAVLSIISGETPLSLVWFSPFSPSLSRNIKRKNKYNAVSCHLSKNYASLRKNIKKIFGSLINSKTVINKE